MTRTRRGMGAVTTETVLCISYMLCILCISLVGGATDPSDGSLRFIDFRLLSPRSNSSYFFNWFGLETVIARVKV